MSLLNQDSDGTYKYTDGLIVQTVLHSHAPYLLFGQA